MATAWDIELSGNFDLSILRTCRIACAVTETKGTQRSWFGRGMGATPKPEMDERDLSDLVNHLRDNGPGVTWHGAAFDYHVLALQSGQLEQVRDLALDSIDLHLLFMAVRRHRLGLKAAAAACGSQKGGGAIQDGMEAVTAWPERWQDVLDYCGQDVAATLAVYEYLKAEGGFLWISSKGKANQFTLPPALRSPETWTVRNLLYSHDWAEAAQWITDPATPEAPVYDWLKT